MKIRKICKGYKADEQYQKLTEKFIKIYDKLEDEFDSEFMKQKYVFNVLAKRYARVKNEGILNNLLDIKNHWEEIPV